MLDEGEGVVVGPVQILQPQHASRCRAESEPQQPQQALGEHDDRVDVRGGRSIRELCPAREQPAQCGPVGTQRGERGVSGVVEHEHGAGNRPKGAAALDRATRQHRQTALGGTGGDLVEQAGLANPGLPDDQEHTPTTDRRPVDQAPRHRELGGAADDDGAARHRTDTRGGRTEPGTTGTGGTRVHTTSTPIAGCGRKAGDRTAAVLRVVRCGVVPLREFGTPGRVALRAQPPTEAGVVARDVARNAVYAGGQQLPEGRAR